MLCHALAGARMAHTLFGGSYVQAFCSRIFQLLACLLRYLPAPLASLRVRGCCGLTANLHHTTERALQRVAANQVSEARRASNLSIYLFDAGTRCGDVCARSQQPCGRCAGSSCPVAYRGDVWGSLDHLPSGGCHPPKGFCHLLIRPYCVYIARE